MAIEPSYTGFSVKIFNFFALFCAKRKNAKKVEKFSIFFNFFQFFSIFLWLQTSIIKNHKKLKKFSIFLKKIIKIEKFSTFMKKNHKNFLIFNTKNWKIFDFFHEIMKNFQKPVKSLIFLILGWFFLERVSDPHFGGFWRPKMASKTPSGGPQNGLRRARGAPKRGGEKDALG